MCGQVAPLSTVLPKPAAHRHFWGTMFRRVVAGTLMLEQLELPLPPSWEEQRARNAVSPKATRALRASR